MKPIHFIVGTMLGSSEYVADHLATLVPDDREINQHLAPDLNDFDLTIPQTWILCTSTHGAGEFPDNILNFIDQLAIQTDLKHIEYAVCALGDTNYDTFCQAGKTVDQMLKDRGAKQITDTLNIDVSTGDIPEDHAQNWFEQWKNKLSS
ncbi:MAG: hypothetical protein BM565_04825 [Gammaproteobacteria bacterium MedPE]|nr:MAG: hypothetical protein BM565_04825 [Gammaproteobacteria bacterium MedPE]